MAITPKTSADLKGVAEGGLINEDVMQEIYNISPIDLPYQDMCGAPGSSRNEFLEWTQDSMESLDDALDNALVDGAPADGNDAKTGRRLGNHHQISGKVVSISDRANNSDTIGRSDELIYQLIRRQEDLKRTQEAILTSPQGSVADAGAGTPGLTAGAAAMFETNIVNGTAGGFASGVFTAPTPGTAKAISESDIRAGMELAYGQGGDPRILMSVPSVIGKFSEYLFTSSARVATLQKDVGTVSQGKYGKQGVTAVGAVNVFVTDFGTLTLTPNRMQLTYTNVSACADVFGFDPDYWEVSNLQGIVTKPLARTGTAENRQMTVDYCNVAKQEASSFIIMGIDPALAATA